MKAASVQAVCRKSLTGFRRAEPELGYQLLDSVHGGSGCRRAGFDAERFDSFHLLPGLYLLRGIIGSPPPAD
jgi:hypothetical protein